MQPSLRHQAIIAIVAGIVFFTNLGVPRLWDRDEPRNAGCAAEMWERGDWVVPTFNSELRTHKPALLYWLMMSAYSVFGVNEFSARLWSALLGIATCLLTYQIGRRLYSPRAGLWAGIVLATALNFGVAARAATPDSVFVFSVTFVLWLFVGGLFPSADKSLQQESGILWQHPTLTTYIWAYLAMGVAVLAKGPIGILLPGGTAGLFLLYATYTTHRSKSELASDDREGGGWKSLILSVLRPFAPLHVMRTIWAMRPFLAMGLVAL